MNENLWPGAFQLIPKETFRKENKSEFQREINEKVIKQWAKDGFSWYKFGVIIVTKKDGIYYPLDGQHRICLAKMFDDVNQLPCFVFDHTSDAEEAKAWLESSLLFRKPDWVDRFPALLAIGDKAAILADKLVKQSGRVMQKPHGPKNICCMNSLHKQCEEAPKVITKLWKPLILPLCEGYSLPQRIVEGLCYLERDLDNGISLLDERWKQKIFTLGYKEILNAAYRGAAKVNFGKAQAWGYGIFEILNDGIKGTKLELKTPISPNFAF